MTSRPPTWVDLATLSAETCLSESTVGRWVKSGLLPPARLRGGKLMWRWSEVDAYLDRGGPAVSVSPPQMPDDVAANVRKVLTAALRQVEKWAIVRELLPHPITLGCEVEGPAGGHVPWSDEHVELAERHARHGLARVDRTGAEQRRRDRDETG